MSNGHEKSRPGFVIIGAQKAASTALVDALTSHPDIWMPDLEDHFLRDPVFDEAGIDAFVEKYSLGSQRLTGLKCPDYLGREEVPRRLVEICGRPKLLLIVRDPVERAISAYFWQVRWGVLPIEDPSVGLARVLDGDYIDLYPSSYEILDWGMYGQHLRRYLEFFDLSDILIIHDQDLRSKPNEVLSESFRFLDVDDTSSQVRKARSSNEGVYEPRRLRFLQIRNRSILRYSDDRSYVTIFKPSNPIRLALSNIVAATDRWLLARLFGNKRPEISPVIRSRLEAYYREDSADFSAMVGQRFDTWTSMRR